MLNVGEDSVYFVIFIAECCPIYLNFEVGVRRVSRRSNPGKGKLYELYVRTGFNVSSSRVPRDSRLDARELSPWGLGQFGAGPG